MADIAGLCSWFGLELFLLPYTAISLVIYYLVLGRRTPEKKNDQKTKNVLVVTAHPDDECMFFGPTILQLVQDLNTKVHLLCLSTGDNKNGPVREKELTASCKILGLTDPLSVIVLNNEKLPDNPDIFWDTDVVSEQILKYTEDLDINMIFTFDASGVSGHKNHISCYKGARALLESHKIPKGIKLYFLQTVSTLRKYLFVLDVPFSILMSRHMFFAGPRNYWKARQAMKAHASQYVWFRRLYIIFSRYMIINLYHKKSVH